MLGIMLFSFGLHAEELSLSCDVQYRDIDQVTTSKQVTGQANLNVYETEVIDKGIVKTNLKVNIDTDLLEGTMKYPLFMIPPLNSAKDGVVRLKKVTISDESYTLISNFNFLNRIVTVIDRKTGGINSSHSIGDLNITGTCSKVETSIPNKF